MVAGWRYATADGGGARGSGDGGGEWQGQSVVFRLHFILYAGNGWGSRERKRGEKGVEELKGRGRMGVRGTLNYNPLRDTAEFAFKIKRA